MSVLLVTQQFGCRDYGTVSEEWAISSPLLNNEIWWAHIALLKVLYQYVLNIVGRWSMVHVTSSEWSQLKKKLSVKDLNDTNPSLAGPWPGVVQVGAMHALGTCKISKLKNATPYHIHLLPLLNCHGWKQLFFKNVCIYQMLSGKVIKHIT